MRRTFTLLAAAAFALSLAGAADASKIDKNGKCHDDSGKFAKMEVCKGAAATPAKPAQCKDAKGKFAKCGTPGATPVPVKK